MKTFMQAALFAVSGLGLAFASTPSQAATFQLTAEDVSPPNSAQGGNYCANFSSGSGDSVCNVNKSPWIVKYEFNENTSGWDLAEFNSYFGSSSDFGGISISDEGGGTWSWTYNNDGNDPGITAFAAKGSNAHNLYEWDGTGAFAGGSKVSFKFPQGNSNITFFDSVGVIPLPAGLPLLLSALGLGGLLRLRQKRKTA